MLKQDPITIFDGLPEGIERAERMGQRRLESADVLPSDMGSSRSVLEAWGVKIGERVAGDSLFVHVTLPPGWEKRRTEHHLWTDLVDERGRKRATIFYKAAFYDRSAYMRACPRYRVDAYLCPRESPQRAAVLDADGTQVFTTDTIPWENTDAMWEKRQALAALCEAWLDEHRSNWRDPLAYWDEP